MPLPRGNDTQSLAVNRGRTLGEFDKAMAEYGQALELHEQATKSKDLARERAEQAASEAIRTGNDFEALITLGHRYGRGVVGSVIAKWHRIFAP